jgi:hypothetical protein
VRDEAAVADFCVDEDGPYDVDGLFEHTNHFDSFGEALKLLDTYPNWTALHVAEVHADFVDQMLAAVRVRVEHRRRHAGVKRWTVNGGSRTSTNQRETGQPIRSRGVQNPQSVHQARR